MYRQNRIIRCGGTILITYSPYHLQVPQVQFGYEVLF